MSTLVPEKSICSTHWFFYVIKIERLWKLIIRLYRPAVNTRHRLEHVRHGFEKLTMIISIWEIVRALRDYNRAKTKNWDVSEQGHILKSTAIYKNFKYVKKITSRFRAMEKIHKLGRWVPHDLTQYEIENCRLTSEILHQLQERK